MSVLIYTEDCPDYPLEPGIIVVQIDYQDSCGEAMRDCYFVGSLEGE